MRWRDAPVGIRNGRRAVLVVVATGDQIGGGAMDLLQHILWAEVILDYAGIGARIRGSAGTENGVMRGRRRELDLRRRTRRQKTHSSSASRGSQTATTPLFRPPAMSPVGSADE